MNDHPRALVSGFFAVAGISLDTLNTALSCTAYAVAIVAGLPAAIRVVKSFIAAYRSR